MAAEPQLITARPVIFKAVSSVYALLLMGSVLFVACSLILRSAGRPVSNGAAEVLCLLVPAVIFARRKSASVTEALRLRPVPVGLLIRAVLIGLVAWSLGEVVYWMTSGPLRVLLGMDGSLGISLDGGPGAPSGLLSMLIGCALTPGICEEVLFRGAIQGVLERKGAWRGLLYTSLLFGLWHLSPWCIPYHMSMGLLLGLLTIRTNSILPAIIVHAVHNARGQVFCRLPSSLEHFTSWPWTIAWTLLLAVLLVEFLHHTRNIPRKPSPLMYAQAGLSRMQTVLYIVVPATFVLLMFVEWLRIPRMERQAPCDFAPDIHRGDRLTISEVHSAHSNDIVIFEQDGQMLLGKVLDITETSLSVTTQPSNPDAPPLTVPRGQFLGRVTCVHSSMR